MDRPSTKTRADLKAFFVTGAIPTQGNFADLIDSGTNQQDDGLVKGGSSPLCIQAGSDPDQPVLSLFKNFTDAGPVCVLRLNPYSNPSDKTSGRPGLGIGDAAGNTRLFLDRQTGNVGIGTVLPQATLHVQGVGWVSGGAGVGVPDKHMAPGSLTIGSTASTYGGSSQGWTTNIAGLLLETNQDTEIAVYRHSDTPTLRHLVGALSYIGAEDSLVIGRNMGGGAITLVRIGGRSESRLQLQPDAGGKRVELACNQAGGLTLRVDNGNATSPGMLDAITILPTTANVGIGTSTPAAALHVEGVGLVSDGGGYAVPQGYMARGSLTIGSINSSFGGSFTPWAPNTASNTAGLLLETNQNTEIAIYHKDTRVVSAICYFGSDNSLTIGRNMGWGAIGAVRISSRNVGIAGNVGIGTRTPAAALHVEGVGLVSDGGGYAVAQGYMAKGSLTIGSITSSFGGSSTKWASGVPCNTAGLLLETQQNTEIAIQHSEVRVVSAIYYDGDKNSLTIGRNMGWGPIARVTIQQEDWQSPASFCNNWKEYYSNTWSGHWHQIGYFKDSCGIVHLRGAVCKAQATSNDFGWGGSATIFQLPEGYRPGSRHHIFVVHSMNSTGAIIRGTAGVDEDGSVSACEGDITRFCLDGISFRAE